MCRYQSDCLFEVETQGYRFAIGILELNSTATRYRKFYVVGANNDELRPCPDELMQQVCAVVNSVNTMHMQDYAGIDTYELFRRLLPD
jgi:hypothetical protein